MMRPSLAALVLATVVLASCARDTTAPLASDVAGTWGPQTSVVGSRWTMRLRETASALTGDGDYALEAGRSGTFAVTGTVSGAQVTLDITYDYGAHERFTGTHTPLDILHGQIVRVVGVDTLTAEQDYFRRGTP